MRLTIPFQYTEQVVPPRCRKPRPETRNGTIQLNFREVTGDEAPVAIIERGTEYCWATDEYGPYTKEYRWYHGKLYERDVIQRVSRGPRETQTAEQFKTDPYPYVFEPTTEDWYKKSQSLAERRKGFRDFAAGLLFIDGVRWKVTGEPRYVIMTFGLGHNHGIGYGTSLDIDQHYNPNIAYNRYFRIDHFELAVREATRIATARGDTKALPILEKQDVVRFEILIPEAVRLRPERQHGKGDPFLNEIEGVIEKAPDASVAGFAVIALATKPVKSTKRK